MVGTDPGCIERIDCVGAYCVMSCNMTRAIGDCFFAGELIQRGDGRIAGESFFERGGAARSVVCVAEMLLSMVGRAVRTRRC